MSANAAATHEFALEPADNSRLASLCGPLDENLRLIETRLGVKIRRRGQSFRIQGEYADAAEAAEAVLKDLYAQARHRDLSAEQVHLCLVEHASGGPGEGADGVIIAPGEAERGAAGRRESVRARGAHQRDYLAHIRNHDLSFGIGPAGTGKTYLAVACAVESCSRSGCAASCWCGLRSRPASAWAFCPATWRRRSIPTCGDVRRTLRNDGLRSRGAIHRAQCHRSGATGLHARPLAQ